MMLKYSVLVLLIVAGLIYFMFMGEDKNEVSTAQTMKMDSSKNTSYGENLKKLDRDEIDEVTEELNKNEEAEADTVEAEETQQDIDINVETDIDAEPTPKRKLVGGAEVEWIEGSDKPKEGNGFGKPPRF